jgi:hypothetical protein
VVGAGNSTGRKQHTAGVVPASAGGNPGVTDVPLHTLKGDAATRQVMFFHADPLSVQLVAPSGASSVAVPTLTETRINLDGVAIHISGQQLTNGDVQLQLDLAAPGRPLIEDGNWLVRFSNAGAHDVPVDAWVASAAGDNKLTFLGPGDTGPAGLRASDLSTITIPATARSAIAVAAYENRTSWCDFFWSGNIAPYSGRGPVRRNAAANPKPDIAAPGTGITAPRNDACNLVGNLCSCCPDWLTVLYDDSSGTSIAAPHVTGAIALMLHVNPTMTRDKAVGFLRNSVQQPAPADPNVWGSGKLDVNAAVALALKDSLPPPTDARAHPATLVRTDARETRAPAPALATLVRTLRKRPDGEFVAALVSRHFSEARRLVNTRRYVATMWHRASGPGLLRQLIAGASEAVASPPDDEQQRYLRRFLDQLSRFGSERLRMAIASHTDLILITLGGPSPSRSPVGA